MGTILGSSDQDRRYLVLCVLAGFLLVVVHGHLEARTSLGPAASFLVVFGVYAVVFDGPHFFATYARTLFDRDFMQQNRRWYAVSFAIIAALPVATLLLLTDGVRPAFSSQLVLGMLLRLAYVFEDGSEGGCGPAVSADTLAAGCTPKTTATTSTQSASLERGRAVVVRVGGSEGPVPSKGTPQAAWIAARTHPCRAHRTPPGRAAERRTPGVGVGGEGRTEGLGEG